MQTSTLTSIYQWKKTLQKRKQQHIMDWSTTEIIFAEASTLSFLL